MPTRFRIMWKFADQHSEPQSYGPWLVLDLEPPGVEGGEVRVFGEFPTKQAAIMTCFALNGAAPEVHSDLGTGGD